MKDKSDTKIKIMYKNWQGEKALRTIIPLRLWFGSTKWHKEKQWLLKAIDVEKNAERDFAVKDIESWSEKLLSNLD